MFARLQFATLLFSALADLMLASAAFAQDDPVTQARAAGLYGLEPKSPTPLEQLVWDRYGIYFQERDNRAFVAGLKPGGAAALQGAKVGDLVRGSDVMGAAKYLSGVLQAFEISMERETGDASFVLRVDDADSGWQRDYRLTPAAADGKVTALPQALRGAATSYSGLMAIISGDPGRAEPIDVAHDAMLALQAISKHVKKCSGPNAVTIPVGITMTETTTDGLGVYRGSESSSYGETLRVRPEFAGWARANIGMYPTQAVSTVRESVLNLISQEGCNGAGFRQLETGLAAVMGVSLPEPSVVPEEEGDGGIPPDANAFISQCYPLFLQSELNRGQSNPSQRGAAQFCMCYEHASRESGDAELYASVSQMDFRYYEAKPELHEAFKSAFGQCYRSPDGSELRRRLEALWYEMRL
ncbi:hypothetical protein SAMN05421538_101208 [Paracoccus isoporae]|uniref:PDZ domain-containing protein n=1 Tax=Paracoccus isoporae TaxID=591205 RepID=A0A1G6T8V1_9RHOB|nr:hypothetical protein [Paracoccus isoporae]SDD24877.1 hypothetical protein SAMN05421538_101208 [Paracoccus isoporae]